MPDRSWGTFKTAGERAGSCRAASPFGYVWLLIGLALAGALLAVAIYIFIVFRFDHHRFPGFIDLTPAEFKRYLALTAAGGGALGLAVGARLCLRWRREEVELREKRRKKR